MKDWLASCISSRIPGIVVDVLGEEWNHSRYQAAVQTEDTLYGIWVQVERRIEKTTSTGYLEVLAT